MLLHRPSLVCNGTLLIHCLDQLFLWEHHGHVWCHTQSIPQDADTKHTKLAEPGKTFHQNQNQPKLQHSRNIYTWLCYCKQREANLCWNQCYRKCNREQTLLEESKDESKCYLTRMPKSCRCFTCQSLVFTALWKSTQCTIDCSVSK